MKTFLILSGVLTMTVAEVPTLRKPFDESKVDIESIVSSPASVKAFTHCFIDKGPCNDAAAFYKPFWPVVLKTACKNCGPIHKHLIKRYLDVMWDEFPEDLNALREKYDPTGEYFYELRAAVLNP